MQKAPSRAAPTALLAIGASLALFLLMAIGLYLAVANHLFIFSHQTVRVVGSSMDPTLHDGQAVTLDFSAYQQHGPARGDLVMLEILPVGGYIERVIGVPGDRIRIAQGSVFINGQPLKEPYVRESWTVNNNWPRDGNDVTVPSRQYFVLGDNRNHAQDSRSRGFIELDAIAGRILPQ
ncbi:MAG: signal peptidase I [Candidatus Dormibacteraeota bacterium]|nr:signal peptidase I [Candidatus Dormibacteraeota bacterium]